MGRLASYPIHVSLLVVNLAGCFSAFMVGALMLIFYRYAVSERTTLHEYLEIGVEAPSADDNATNSFLLKDPQARDAYDDDAKLKLVSLILATLCFALGSYLLKQVLDQAVILGWRPIGGFYRPWPIKSYRTWMGHSYVAALRRQGKTWRKKSVGEASTGDEGDAAVYDGNEEEGVNYYEEEVGKETGINVGDARKTKKTAASAKEEVNANVEDEESTSTPSEDSTVEEKDATGDEEENEKRASKLSRKTKELSKSVVKSLKRLTGMKEAAEEGEEAKESTLETTGSKEKVESSTTETSTLSSTTESDEEDSVGKGEEEYVGDEEDEGDYYYDDEGDESGPQGEEVQYYEEETEEDKKKPWWKLWG